MGRSLRERYENDPVFYSLVRLLRGFLLNNRDYTPTELREAATFAASLHEAEHVEPILDFRTEEERERWWRSRGLRP